MNPRTQAVIAVAVIALLGAGVWLGRAREANNNNLENCLTAGTTDPYNVNLGLPPCSEGNNNAAQNESAQTSATYPVIEILPLGAPVDGSEYALWGEKKVWLWSTSEGTRIIASVFDSKGESLDAFVDIFKNEHGAVDFSDNEEGSVDGRRALIFTGSVELTTKYVMFAYGSHVISLTLSDALPVVRDTNGVDNQTEMKRLAEVKAREFSEALNHLTLR